MPLPSNTLVGSFVFRNEGDGCLTSKYHRIGSVEGPFTEASKLIPNSKKLPDAYTGKYETVWIEDYTNCECCELEIKYSTSSSKIFDLVWYNPKKKSERYFEGTAMLFGELLVGAYWDV